MGTYIKTVCEVFNGEVWTLNERPVFSNDPNWPGTGSCDLIDTPFFWQSYGMYSLLANVRNTQGIKPIASPRGLPNDTSMEALDELLGDPEQRHWVQIDKASMTVDDRITSRIDPDLGNFSWVTAHELLSVDYTVLVPSRQNEGSFEQLAESLIPRYFEHLKQLESLGKPENVRILFGFQ